MFQQMFASGQDQPDDQLEQQNHNFYNDFIEYSQTQVSSREAMAIAWFFFRIIDYECRDLVYQTQWADQM